MNDGDTKEAVLKLFSANNKASAATIAKTISVAQRTVERYIKEFREEGRLIRHGSARGGYWEVGKISANLNQIAKRINETRYPSGRYG